MYMMNRNRQLNEGACLRYESDSRNEGACYMFI